MTYNGNEPKGYYNNEPDKPIWNYNEKGLPICGAKNRAGDPCHRPAGWGTDHVGYGRCKLHGGKSKGAKVKHGIKQPIYYHTLSEQEQGMWEDIPTDLVECLDNAIKLNDIEIMRFMERLNTIQENEMSITKQVTEVENGMGTDSKGEPMPISRQKQTTERTSGMDMAVKLEEALTKKQNVKAKLLDLKFRIQAGENPQEVIVSSVRLQKIIAAAKAKGGGK